MDAFDDKTTRQRLITHRAGLAARLAAQERILAHLKSLIQKRGRIIPYEVEIIEDDPPSILATRMITSMSTIAEEIGKGIGALMSEMERLGVHPTGPPLVVYHGVTDEQNDGEVEVCVPVPVNVEGEGEVYGRVLEGEAIAMTVHRGPYPEIGPAYRTPAGWILDHGCQIAGPPREVYLNDPQLVPTGDLLTRVEFPIR